jgi:hypothetical protein
MPNNSVWQVRKGKILRNETCNHLSTAQLLTLTAKIHSVQHYTCKNKKLSPAHHVSTHPRTNNFLELVNTDRFRKKKRAGQELAKLKNIQSFAAENKIPQVCEKWEND